MVVSWHDKYLEQERAWLSEAQKYAAQGNYLETNSCLMIADLYKNLAERAIDKPSQDDKM